jgi:hypothetical protein
VEKKPPKTLKTKSEPKVITPAAFSKHGDKYLGRITSLLPQISS